MDTFELTLSADELDRLIRALDRSNESLLDDGSHTEHHESRRALWAEADRVRQLRVRLVEQRAAGKGA